MTAITTANGNLPTTISTKFSTELENDLGAGISGGFGTIGYKGKSWSTRYKGEEKTLMRPDGDGPRNSIDVVILKAAKVLSKTFYEKYVEGSNSPPDCASTNGITPDPSSPKKQAAVCGVCPRNQWGTALLQDGTPGKGKACKDNKRLAVVPAEAAVESPGVLRNEMFGGPMMLRVPPASLQDLATYGERMKAKGYPYQAVITKIAFDPQAATPKFVFVPQRPLTDAEADVVLELAKSEQVHRILAEEAPAQVPALAAPPQEAPLFAAPLPTQAPAQAPVTPQVVAAAPAPAALPVQDVQAAPEPQLTNKFESELDALLAS